MNDVVSQAIVRMFEKERFYAEIMSEMRRIEDPKLPATAGVCIKDQIELHINLRGLDVPTEDGKIHHIQGFGELEFSVSKNIDEPVAILRHECEHILRNHIGRMKELSPEIFNNSKDIAENIINNMKFKCLNVAADCAINGHIEGMPAWGFFPKNFDLKNGETLEWYLEQLKNNDKTKGLTEFDSHSLWHESDENGEILKEKIRRVVNRAAEKTRAAGKMTAEDELIVEEFNSGNLVCWRQQLKNFVAKNISCKIESSRKKRNRRYGIMYPGVKKTEELHLGVAIDTSGSMSDEALFQAMREIHEIAKYAIVTVVEADAEIKDSYIFDPKKTYRVKGRGGTAYQPTFAFFNDIDVDAMVYIGDMDCSDIPEKPRYPVLWAVVGDQNPPVSWGRVVRIKV